MELCHTVYVEVQFNRENSLLSFINQSATAFDTPRCPARTSYPMIGTIRIINRLFIASVQIYAKKIFTFLLYRHQQPEYWAQGNVSCLHTVRTKSGIYHQNAITEYLGSSDDPQFVVLFDRCGAWNSCFSVRHIVENYSCFVY